MATYLFTANILVSDYILSEGQFNVLPRWHNVTCVRT